MKFANTQQVTKKEFQQSTVALTEIRRLLDEQIFQMQIMYKREMLNSQNKSKKGEFLGELEDDIIYKLQNAAGSVWDAQQEMKKFYDKHLNSLTATK